MARNFSALATEVSKLINDSQDCDEAYNFTRWSKSELIHYAADAVTMLFTLLPQKFTDLSSVPLRAGIVQKLPAHCTKVTKVLGIEDSCGALSSIAPNGDDRLGSLFTNSCASSVASNFKYGLSGFSLEETSDNLFYVQPPVPSEALPLNVSVICSVAPDIEEMDGDFVAAPWMHNMLIEWMQYRAYGSEDESVNSNQVAKSHLEHFYAQVSNFRKAEESLMEVDTSRTLTNQQGSR